MKPVFFALRNGLQNRSIAPASLPACMVILFSACFASHQAPENQDASVREQDASGTQYQNAPGTRGRDATGTSGRDAPGPANAADLRGGAGIAGQSGTFYGFPVADAGVGSDGGAVGAIVPQGVRPVCGNQRVESGEHCDGQNLGGFDCLRLGFERGVLRCDPTSCLFDTSGCGGGPLCGNGVIEDGESCEGSDLNGSTCQSMGFGGGQLRCNPARCVFDFSNCRRLTCGDGMVEGEEQCDGDNLDGMSCIGLGYQGGTLYCDSATCAFDVSHCVYQYYGRGYRGLW
jgi:hypothetical protein